jgi:hypothetical protein
MSRTWKWILGIVLGLAVIAGLGFVAVSYFGFGHISFFGGPAYASRPMMNGYGFNNRGPMEGFRDFRAPLMGRRGFGGYGFIGLPFLFLGGFLRLVIPLGVLALVAFFAYRAGKHAGMNAALATGTSVPAPAPDPKEAPEQRERKVASDE